MSELSQEYEDNSFEFLTDISTNCLSDCLSFHDPFQPVTHSPILNLSPFPFEDLEPSEIVQTTPNAISITPCNRDRIGALSLEERREKVEKYLIKKRRRVFGKKVSYNCRKRVADGRIRIKGRFVTKEKAEELASKSLNNDS